MRSNIVLRVIWIFVVATLVLVTANNAWSASYKVLHVFRGNAIGPSSGLAVDTAGNAYGTAFAGGNFGGHGGAVYRLSPTKGFSVLYNFNAPPDGFYPQGNLVIDSAGNLYGTTVYGGANKTGCNGHGCGTVFELSPPISKGGSWTETILYSFTGGDDGANPQAGVILDSAGNLYGTTENGGNLGAGTVFEVTNSGNGQWVESVIYSMDDGALPMGSLVFDATGNLYSTTFEFGGGGGNVFELFPEVGGGWGYVRLYAFMEGTKDGFAPEAGVILDSSGSLYGTTAFGGQFGFGTVFKLTPDAGTWTETILYNFAGGKDGATPRAGLVFDPAGNLYSTTFEGGNASPKACQGNGCGTAFELTPGTSGLWTERLFAFPQDGHLGIEPAASLLLDATGRAYGTTTSGGEGIGVVFRITP